MTFDPSRLADPAFFAENRMAARSDHRWFRSEAELAAGSSSFEQSLGGLWKFHYARNQAETIPGFQDPDFDAAGWAEIPVPGHIQLNGYGRPQYANVQYPWDGWEEIAPGEIPERFNPVASYRTTFTLDRPLASGERLALDVKGAESAIAVWVNGSYIGFAADSFAQAEFDLTDALVDGENTLAAQVFMWTSGSWLEDQDFYRFSGIFRDVLLVRRPVVHIEDVHVRTEVAGDAAEIAVALKVAGEGAIRVELEGVGELAFDGESYRIAVPQPRLWSPEDPHLYRLLIRASDATGELVELAPQRVGLRRFAIEDGVLALNGRRVVFFGVNRHEFGLEGRVMSRAQTEADLRLLKKAGVNAIRTSHYPNNAFFYELADEYGFLVIDEMNMETHGVWDRVRELDRPVEEALPGDREEWRPAVLDRALGLFERDKNHPSIVIFSCGNESFGGSVIRDVADFFRSVDTRPVHYEGVDWDPRYPETTDIMSRMYTPAAEVEEQLRTHRDKPFILCEYAHAMGNSFGAVDRYIDLAYREPLFQGGFIWDFADQAVLLTDRYGERYLGYGGDAGERPHDGDFCGNGILFADHSPSPKMQEVRHLYQPLRVSVQADAVEIENRFLFTSSSALEAVVEVRQQGRSLAVTTLETDVAPGESGRYPLPVPPPRSGGEYTVDVRFLRREATRWADAGEVVAQGQGVFAGIAVPSTARCRRPELVQGTHNVSIRGENFGVLFSQLYGGLVSYRYGSSPEGGRELLTAMPKPNFWHAPTANERGWGSPFEDGAWLLASRYARPLGARLRTGTITTDEESVTVGYVYELPTTPRSECAVDYRVTGDGRIEVTVSMEYSEELPDMPEFGMLIEVDPELQRLRWYGDGPEESYVDRRLGARRDVFAGLVAEQLPAYLKPQESGSRTGVQWVTVTDAGGVGLRLESSAGMEFSALPWTPFEIENAAHPHELPRTTRTVLRPALQRRGVGGDDSWGARTHPEHLLPRGRLEFRFTLRAVGPAA